MANSTAGSAGIDTLFVLQHINGYLGPNIVAICIQGLETGLLLNQLTRFWVHAWDREQWVVRLLVYFVAAVGLTQTGLGFWRVWNVNVTNFGNLAFAVIPSTYDCVSTVLNTVISAAAHAFLIWRCWSLAGRHLYILVPLAALLVASVGLGIWQATFLWKIPPLMSKVLINNPTLRPNVAPSVLGDDFLLAAMNTAITSILLSRLWKQQRTTISRRNHMGIETFVILAWTCSIPGTISSWASVIMLYVDLYPSKWGTMVQQIIGKLYAITLLVTFNSRVSAEPPTRTGTRISQLRFRSVVPIDLPFPERLRQANLESVAFPFLSRDMPITLSQVPDLSIPPSPATSFVSPTDAEKPQDRPGEALFATAVSPSNGLRPKSLDYPMRKPVERNPYFRDRTMSVPSTVEHAPSV